MSERYALLSVTDKTGLPALARVLQDRGYRLISTGGTATILEAAKLRVIQVSAFTGEPEMFGGRIKTLHSKIAAGVLSRRTVEDRQEMAKRGWPEIDVVVINLYDFEGTIRKPGITPAEAIEQIDIGGPTWLRAAAKNYAHVAVLSNPSQYGRAIEALRSGPEIPLELRETFAKAVFPRTGSYDDAISVYFNE